MYQTVLVKRKKNNTTERVTCNQCGKSITKNRFMHHVMIHTGEKPHPCIICGRRFRLKTDLKQHNLTHTGEKPYACDMCDKKFADSSSRNKHIRIHTGEKLYSCEFCQRAFTQIAGLREHQVTHTGIKSHTCEFCLKKFTTKSSMRRHTLTHLNTCEVCGATYKTDERLQKHRELHSLDRPYSCTVCDRRFMRKADLCSHLQVHADDAAVVYCTVCNGEFKSCRILRHHHYRHHKGIEIPFSCFKCNRKFFQEESLNRHLRGHSNAEKRGKGLYRNRTSEPLNVQIYKSEEEHISCEPQLSDLHHLFSEHSSSGENTGDIDDEPVSKHSNTEKRDKGLNCNITSEPLNEQIYQTEEEHISCEPQLSDLHQLLSEHSSPGESEGDIDDEPVSKHSNEGKRDKGLNCNITSEPLNAQINLTEEEHISCEPQLSYLHQLLSENSSPGENKGDIADEPVSKHSNEGKRDKGLNCNITSEPLNAQIYQTEEEHISCEPQLSDLHRLFSEHSSPGENEGDIRDEHISNDGSKIDANETVLQIKENAA